MTHADRQALREIAHAACPEKGPCARSDRWELQTSNSFRRIGARGDGDVLYATIQRSDGHPDLQAAPGVLDYIVAAQPKTIIALLDEIDRLERELAEAPQKIMEDILARMKEPT